MFFNKWFNQFIKTVDLGIWDSDFNLYSWLGTDGSNVTITGLWKAMSGWEILMRKELRVWPPAPHSALLAMTLGVL